MHDNSSDHQRTTRAISLHRVLRAPPSVVFTAFIDPVAICRWSPPYGFLAEMHEHEVKVGGKHRMSFRNFRTGAVHSFGGEFLEIIPDERLVYTDRFDDEALQGELKVTVILKKVACGSELFVTQENIPAIIPLEMCYLGWQESLSQLQKLVEVEIP